MGVYLSHKRSFCWSVIDSSCANTFNKKVHIWKPTFYNPILGIAVWSAFPRFHRLHKMKSMWLVDASTTSSSVTHYVLWRQLWSVAGFNRILLHYWSTLQEKKRVYVACCSQSVLLHLISCIFPATVISKWICKILSSCMLSVCVCPTERK
jgi:hypothetical protein